jgi:exosortase/archaeosortase family protein
MKAHNLPKIIFALVAFVLALDPIKWLVNTWLDPSYDSQGFVIFCVCIVLFIWSVSSNRISSDAINLKTPAIILGISAFVRLLGQIYAVNIIGALTLVLDSYAIALLSGLHLRKRSLSPGWFAVCFAFSLPLERVLQRTIGYGLQSISADGACFILDTLFDDVSCHGIRIWINQMDVLIDLPCSGARAALLLQFLYAASMTICRPSFKYGILGILVTLAASLSSNILRIIVFALNISFPEYFFGLDVMSDPLHDLVGLFFLIIGGIPIIYWALNVYQPYKYETSLSPYRHKISSKISFKKPWQVGGQNTFASLPLALVCFCLAITIINLPRNPIDVGKKNLPIYLPTWINGDTARIAPLLPKEEAYFTNYGGTAVKADFGMHSLLMVKTSSPLRHLHSPDECLRGLGFKVRYQGSSNSSVPSSIYKAVSQENRSYRIAVTFISDKGISTNNISEAIWHWFKDPKSEWMSVQRISPWRIEANQHEAWDKAVFAALDISPNTLTKSTKLHSRRKL